MAIVEGSLPTIEEIFSAYTVLYGDGDLSIGLLHGYARGGGFYHKMLEFRYDIDQRTLAITINPNFSVNYYANQDVPRQVSVLFYTNKATYIIQKSTHVIILLEN